MRLGRHLALVLLRAVLTGAHVPTYGVRRRQLLHAAAHAHHEPGRSTSRAAAASRSTSNRTPTRSTLRAARSSTWTPSSSTSTTRRRTSLFIGCGGCVPCGPNLVEPRQAAGWLPAGRGRAVHADAGTARCSPRPLASTTRASSPGCTENHFTIRVIGLPQPHRDGARDARVGRGHRAGRDVHVARATQLPARTCCATTAPRGTTWSGPRWRHPGRRRRPASGSTAYLARRLVGLALVQRLRPPDDARAARVAAASSPSSRSPPR